MKRQFYFYAFRVWALAFFVSIFVLSGCSSDSNSVPTPVIPKQKVAIIDAGSSGSRLYLYEVKDNGKTISLIYPTTSEEAKAAKGPALSSLKNDDADVATFLNEMTSKHIVSNAQIPLYVLATAGMRLQPEEQTKGVYAKMNAHKEIINGYKLARAMTISGRYEGLYAWISANYQAKTLSSSTPFGIMEIGGASMQVTFSTTSVQLPSQYSKSIISHPNYGNIYSRSCFGGVDVVYNSLEDKTQVPSNYNVDVEDVSSIIGNTRFLACGKPMEVYLKGLADNGGFEGYTNYLKQQESDPYHSYLNAFYIKWVLGKNGLSNYVSLPSVEISWTEGAAIDIVSNQHAPEQYDYSSKN